MFLNNSFFFLVSIINMLNYVNDVTLCQSYILKTHITGVLYISLYPATCFGCASPSSWRFKYKGINKTNSLISYLNIGTGNNKIKILLLSTDCVPIHFTRTWSFWMEHIKSKCLYRLNFNWQSISIVITLVAMVLCFMTAVFYVI
jgi:hypothetical protein